MNLELSFTLRVLEMSNCDKENHERIQRLLIKTDDCFMRQIQQLASTVQKAGIQEPENEDLKPPSPSEGKGKGMGPTIPISCRPLNANPFGGQCSYAFLLKSHMQQECPADAQVSLTVCPGSQSGVQASKGPVVGRQAECPCCPRYTCIVLRALVDTGLAVQWEWMKDWECAWLEPFWFLSTFFERPSEPYLMSLQRTLASLPVIWERRGSFHILEMSKRKM